MNKELTKLFNNGINTGDMTIICSGQERIQCHSFVMENQSDFIKGYTHFKQEQNPTNESKTISLIYPLKVVLIVVNKMYSSDYNIPDISIEEILMVVKLMDEIIIMNRDTIIENLLYQFSYKITVDNWFDLLCSVFKNNLYERFQHTIILYFSDIVISDYAFNLNNFLQQTGNIDPEIIILLLDRCVNKIQHNSSRNRY